MSLVYLFVASFFNVFLLGLNSQFVRDQLVALAFIMSWGVISAQFVFTRVIAHTDNPTSAFLVAGFGSSFGICSSIYFYKWFIPHFGNWRNGKGFNNVR